MYGPRYDHHVPPRRHDLYAYHRIQIRHPGQPSARTGVPEQRHPPEPHGPAQGRGGKDARGPLLLGRGPQGVRQVSRRDTRHADRRADHLPRHRKERRPGGGLFQSVESIWKLPFTGGNRYRYRAFNLLHCRLCLRCISKPWKRNPFPCADRIHDGTFCSKDYSNVPYVFQNGTFKQLSGNYSSGNRLSVFDFLL